jgi:pyruvate dehydrogenase E2 component (dihydrolipoamide acetyltransferase)
MARKLARDSGIDFKRITPADGKRIFKSDVLGFAGKVAKPKREERRVPLYGMRKIIAQRMSQSYFLYPTVTLTTDADMSGFLKMREQLNEKLAPSGLKLSVTDLLIKTVAKAIEENEIINTSLIDDEIIFHSEINIGIAVALETGLLVPVIKNVQDLKIDEIAAESKRLIGLAKSGQISGDDMSDGTFTITNLGTAGIDAFNPIISYPQSAILGVGRTVEKVVVVNGEIVIQPRAVFSLTHDHRVIDGVPAADFLHTVVKYIEQPFLLLMD